MTVATGPAFSETAAGLVNGPAAKLKAAIVGGSGYAGGELLRLLLSHPGVEVTQVTSRRYAGQFVHLVHPNLRRRTTLQFVSPEVLAPSDLLFLSLPHGEGVKEGDKWLALAPKVIDLSADYRLRDASQYPVWYGWPHPAPHTLAEFVYGLPELHRAEIAGAKWVSGTGCLATAASLALAPLFKHGLAQPDVFIEGKFGSSAGGAEPSPASHHSERANVVRTYEPVGHRHTAEIMQETAWAANQGLAAVHGPEASAGLAQSSSATSVGAVTRGAASPAPAPRIHLAATAVDMVRGVQAVAHVMLRDAAIGEKDVWKVYRQEYGSEPFIRMVKERHGAHRFPDPKVLAGSNYCDIGFAKDPHSERLVVISAIDNLMKGAAGNAVQAMNVMMGWPETAGLDFAGLHPA